MPAETARCSRAIIPPDDQPSATRKPTTTPTHHNDTSDRRRARKTMTWVIIEKKKKVLSCCTARMPGQESNHLHLLIIDGVVRPDRLNTQSGPFSLINQCSTSATVSVKHHHLQRPLLCLVLVPSCATNRAA